MTRKIFFQRRIGDQVEDICIFGELLKGIYCKMKEAKGSWT
jgi:hypothetical protein